MITVMPKMGSGMSIDSETGEALIARCPPILRLLIGVIDTALPRRYFSARPKGRLFFLFPNPVYVIM